MSVSEIINELQGAMLYFENIEKFSKDIYFADRLEENKKCRNEIRNDIVENKDELEIIPEYSDKLFWIFYILSKGLSSYTLILGNNFKEENKEKIKLVEIYFLTLPLKFQLYFFYILNLFDYLKLFVHPNDLYSTFFL